MKKLITIIIMLSLFSCASAKSIKLTGKQSRDILITSCKVAADPSPKTFIELSIVLAEIGVMNYLEKEANKNTE